MQRYSPFQAALHWASAALILFSLVSELVLKFLPNDAHKITPLRAHMIIGGLIGLIIIARLILRFATRQPDRFKSGSAFLDASAPSFTAPCPSPSSASSRAALRLLFSRGFPPSSLAALERRFRRISGNTHRASCTRSSANLIVLVGLHVAAAVYHQFVRKDRLFQRMGFTRS